MTAPSNEEATRVLAEKDQKYGLPTGTLGKVWGIESSNGKDMLSPKGAMGHFQFTEATGKKFGLVNPEDYNDFHKSSDAAGAYLSTNLKRFNGNMDMALTEYNGGGNAVKALASGKPWKETKDYLSKFNVGGATPYKDTSNMAGFNPSPLTAAPSSAELDKQRQQQQYEHGGVLNNIADTPRAASLTFQQENSVYNWWQERGISDHVDPDFTWNKERMDGYLKDIPHTYWAYITQAKSDKEAALRADRMRKSMQNSEELGRMGLGATLAGGLIGTLPDFDSLLMALPPFGLAVKASRTANAVRSGLAAATANVAFDAATQHLRPMATHDDLYMSGLMGLALGGVGGAAMSTKGVAKSHLSEENMKLGQFGYTKSQELKAVELESSGYKLTPQGEEAFRPTKYAAPKHSVDPEVAKIIQNIRDESHEIMKLYQHNPQGRELYVPINAPGNDAKRAAALVEGAVESKGMSKTGTEAEVPAPIHTVQSTRTEHVPKSKAGVEHPSEPASVVLSNLISKGDPMHSALATRLKEQLGSDVKVYTIPKSEMPRSAAAYYHPHEHAIYISKTTLDTTKIHEIAHAVQVYKLDYGKANPNTAHGQLYAEMDGLYKEAKQAAKDAGFSSYYLSDMYEFSAGLYGGASAKPFVEFLSKIKTAEGKTMLSKFVDTIRKLLGMDDKETNLFIKSLGISDKLIDEKLDVRLVNPYSQKERKLHLDEELQPSHAGVDPETVKAANDANVSAVFGIGLSLEHKLGGAKVPQMVRNLASKLFGSTVGYKDHSVVKANAWDDTTQLANSWSLKMRKEAYPAFETWFSESGRKGSDKGEAFEEFGELVSNYIRGFEGDHHAMTSKAGEAIRKVLDEAREHINNPLYREGGTKRGLTETTVKDPETGVESIIGALEANPFYLPRKHDRLKWDSVIQRFGAEQAEGWWARAYQAGRQGISDEKSTQWAKWYISTVEDAHANRTGDLLENMMRGSDREALKNSMMRKGGFSEKEAWELIDDMFPTARSAAGNDVGRLSSSLKHRNTIKEAYSEVVTTASGEKVTMSLNDFVHSNAFDVVEPYLRKTAGNVSLAKHLDVYKVGDIDSLIEEVTRNKFGATSLPDSKLKEYRDHLKLAFDEIQANPREEFTGIRKGFQMWRDFNVIRLMGGAVWNQMSELSQIAGSMGWKATTAAVRELESLKRDILTGKAPHDYLDHLENTIGGVGSEYISRIEFKAADDWVRNSGNTAMNRGLDRLDTGLKKMSKGVLDYTGMTPLMIQQKRVHAIALVNHIVDAAHNTKITRSGESITMAGGSTFLTKDRLAAMGLSEKQYAAVLESIQKFSAPKKGEFGKAYKLDFAGWMKTHPEEHAQFLTAVNRESRRVIQEPDLASMVPLMGTTLGQTVFQFMNFSIQGWNKSMLYALNHRDWTTMSTMLHGGVMASVTYMGRTMLQAQGMSEEKRQEFLNKRMSSSQIVANGFGKVAQASLLPNIYDTMSPFPMFNGMRTTSDLSSMASNPTYQAIQSLLSMKKLIRNGISDEYQTTSQDIKSWGKLVPLNNVAPMSTFLNHLANDYPMGERE